MGGFELPDKNAAAHRALANAKLLREMGFEVKFVGISKDIENAPNVVDGFESCPIPYPISLKQWLHQILTFYENDKILAYKPDYVVLYNFPSVASLKILRTCHKHGIKVIHDLTEWENADGWDPRTIVRKFDINLRMRYCTKKMDGIICISRYLFDYYKNYTNCILVPPTIDLQASKWNRCRDLTAGEKIKLVYAGNAGFGVKDRLDIIVDEVVKFPNMQLDVIGMTGQDYTNGYGPLPKVCNNIIFHGRVPHRDAIKAVQGADFQFLIRDSNRKNNAGFPTKFVESMACCTPMIVTLTSNIGDYIEDGKNCFIVTSKKTLKAVLSQISCLKKEDIISIKNNCRNTVVFDFRKYKETFSKLFQ
jgi:glycosyltransferase involved in cell wall biosynthesis